jgi:GNAT superfamily N-acetyltransferase
VDVVPVEGPRELSRFIRVPFDVYRDDPHWVAPLLGDERVRLTPGKNPFFEHGEAAYFLARDGGRVTGRVAASVDQNHDRTHGERQGAFGFFEATSAEASAALLAAAESWVRAKGATIARGPLSFTTNDECGLLVEGFGRSQPLLMPYNPPAYEAWIEAAGYRKAKDLYSFTIPGPYATPAAFYRIAEMARRRSNVVTRPIDMKRFDAELGLVKEIYNSAWEKNWGFVPMTEAEIDHMARQLKPAVVPDLVRFAEVDGKAVAFLLYVPDVNLALKPVKGSLFPFGIFRVLWGLPRIREGRLMALGVVHAHRRTGLAPALVVDLGDALNRHGYRLSTIGWTLEDNDAVNSLATGFGCTRSAVHRVYEKSLTA